MRKKNNIEKFSSFIQENWWNGQMGGTEYQK